MKIRRFPVDFFQICALIIAMSEKIMKPKIIQVYNKKNKTTYLYEDIAYWDPELKQGRHKRKGIGKLDANGKPVYNNYYLSRYEKQTDEETLVVSSTALLGECRLPH